MDRRCVEYREKQRVPRAMNCDQGTSPMNTARSWASSTIAAGLARSLPRAGSVATAALLFAALAAGCSHGTPHQQVADADAQLAGRLGRAKRGDVLALLGRPTAEDHVGDLEVWVYQYEASGAKRKEKPEMEVVAPVHDELILTFDADGILQRYQVVVEGRRTRRERNR
jgi:outer membrane protein assembly factor BamE (lipoprotein component of BamABCDE complex)